MVRKATRLFRKSYDPDPTGSRVGLRAEQSGANSRALTVGCLLVLEELNAAEPFDPLTCSAGVERRSFGKRGRNELSSRWQDRASWTPRVSSGVPDEHLFRALCAQVTHRAEGADDPRRLAATNAAMGIWRRRGGIVV